MYYVRLNCLHVYLDERLPGEVEVEVGGHVRVRGFGAWLGRWRTQVPEHDSPSQGQNEHVKEME